MLPDDWDVEADVVVVGFGGAGACAALEAAAAGCSVLVLDRFGGGGATALSGGVVYAGGGTPQQRAAGVTDTPEAMLSYLRTEVGDAVPAATLEEFCHGSAAMLAWLEGHGVPFEGSLCPDKTSYPTNRHYLYYSGSELSVAEAAGDDAVPAAPRGHRTRGRGTSGALFYARLAAAVRAAGVRAATAFLDRVSVWRFLSPPPALLTGVLVDRAGERVCDESRYGAALGDAIVRRGGRATTR
jgi:3-oxo-5alpha-steroid 4-dehydrogenase